jgi:hypothetical protein
MGGDPECHCRRGLMPGIGRQAPDGFMVSVYHLGSCALRQSKFTLTFCAIEKSNRFNPPTACKIALANKTEIEHDPYRSVVCWLRFQ